MPLKTDCYCVFMHVFCCMHIVIKRCGVCGLSFVDLSLGSASGKCEEVFWSSLSVAGCLCNFMANCIVSMQQCLFTRILLHKSPRAPINMSETSSERAQWRLLNSYFVNAEWSGRNFSQLLLFIAMFVSKDPMKWFDKRSLEVVGMFNSEMAFTAFSLPQLCKTSLGNLYHKWCNENTFKMDDDVSFATNWWFLKELK